jgi:hypothetical protein
MKCFVVTVMAVVVLVVLSPASRASASDRTGVVRLPLSSIRAGVSARSLAGTPVFFVREGDSVTTFLTDPHETPGLHILWWCPTEGIFIEPIHAGAFDIQGRIVGGPARRGLDQLKTEVTRRRAVVHTNTVRKGGTARYDPLAGNSGGSYDYPGIYATPWNSGPQSFCNQPIIGGRT